ncbi:MAG TPA: hypothetical protein VHN55_03220 [Sphingomicrobium sp.]|nr:hypothetical protein [Sphingomicrobium sp.]
MNWTVLVIAFCLAVLAGAISATTLARMRPDWSNRRRLVVASAVLPGVTLLASGVLAAIILLSDAGEGEDMRDLAAASVVTFGGAFALLALLGGLIGAGLRQRGMKR